MPVTVELDDSAKHIILHAEWRYKELCKSVPGARWDVKQQIWSYPTSWATCLALRSTFRDALEIGPGLNAWATNELQTRIGPANALRDLENMIEGDPALYPHQRAGVQFLATAEGALLADEPGLGKTAQAIRALAEAQRRGNTVFPALVVAPNTLKKNWQREFAHWWPGVNVQVIHGSALQRRKQFAPFITPNPDEPTPHVVVMNWESLRAHSRLAPYGSISLAKCPEHGGEDERITPARCEVHIRELNQIEFKSVIADEIHRSKDPKSKQTRALWAAAGDAKYRFALTGTPIANNALDLWSILHFISPTEWPSKSKWMDRMVDTMLNAFGGIAIIGIKPQMEAEFHATINPRMRRMLKARVLPNLPPMLHERKDVEMSAKQKKAYKQMREDMIAELDNTEILLAPSVLTQTTRLLQFASSYAEMTQDPITGEVKTTLAEPSNKIDALMDDIDNGDFGDDSVAVCAVSRQLIELLSARLTKAKISHGLVTGKQSADQRQNSVDDFQAGRTKWILYTAQAGGVGITLTAARQLVMLQRPWSLVDYKQAIDRIHRIGSEIHDSVVVKAYVTEDSIEERVLEVLEQKGEALEQVVRDRDKMKELLRDFK